jgi:hypothetical protein
MSTLLKRLRERHHGMNVAKAGRRRYEHPHVCER